MGIDLRNMAVLAEADLLALAWGQALPSGDAVLAIAINGADEQRGLGAIGRQAAELHRGLEELEERKGRALPLDPIIVLQRNSRQGLFETGMTPRHGRFAARRKGNGAHRTGVVDGVERGDQRACLGRCAFGLELERQRIDAGDGRRRQLGRDLSRTGEGKAEPVGQRQLSVRPMEPGIFLGRSAVVALGLDEGEHRGDQEEHEQRPHERGHRGWRRWTGGYRGHAISPIAMGVFETFPQRLAGKRIT